MFFKTISPDAKDLLVRLLCRCGPDALCRTPRPPMPTSCVLPPRGLPRGGSTGPATAPPAPLICGGGGHGVLPEAPPPPFEACQRCPGGVVRCHKRDHRQSVRQPRLAVPLMPSGGLPVARCHRVPCPPPPPQGGGGTGRHATSGHQHPLFALRSPPPSWGGVPLYGTPPHCARPCQARWPPSGPGRALPHRPRPCSLAVLPGPGTSSPAGTRPNALWTPRRSRRTRFSEASTGTSCCGRYTPSPRPLGDCRSGCGGRGGAGGQRGAIGQWTAEGEGRRIRGRGEPKALQVGHGCGLAERRKTPPQQQSVHSERDADPGTSATARGMAPPPVFHARR